MTENIRFQNTVYLSVPINTLVEGIYEKNEPFSEIKKYGDFGLGTFKDLDGEMIMLDGKIYQIAADGKVALINDDALSPFSCVTFYKPLIIEEITKELSYADFTKWLYYLMPSTNIFYAFRIEGTFRSIKTRSIPKQKNYRPLVEIADEQVFFNFENIEGTVAGFFTPPFMSSISVSGLHLHFLSKDLKHGGHLLECSPIKAQVGIEYIEKLELSLPMSVNYLTHNFARNVERDLDKIE